MLPDGSFPEPKSLNVLEIGNSKDMRTMVYDVGNPHPGYMKDNNILNEMGHTVYPKIVYPEGNEKPGVIVQNMEEEVKLMGQAGNQLEAKLDDDMAALERKLADMKAQKEKLEHLKLQVPQEQKPAW